MTNLGKTISTILMTGALTSLVAAPVIAQVTSPTPAFVSGCFATDGYGWCPIHAGNYLLNPTGVPVSVTSPGKATPNWGTTVTNIPTLFAATQVLSFQNNPNLNAVVTGMDIYMLARFSTELSAHGTTAQIESILESAAKKVSGANLRKLESAFGPAWMPSALEVAPAVALEAYDLLPVPQPLALSAYSRDRLAPCAVLGPARTRTCTQPYVIPVQPRTAWLQSAKEF
jgi:hypothetical protein